MKVWHSFPAPRGNTWVTADVPAVETRGEQKQEEYERCFAAAALNGKQALISKSAHNIFPQTLSSDGLFVLILISTESHVKQKKINKKITTTTNTGQEILNLHYLGESFSPGLVPRL